jgi:hypothetical protein
MPYVRQRVPAVVAVAYVMRSDRCDRAVAMRQIEAAALDGALRWVRRGADRVFRHAHGKIIPPRLRKWSDRPLVPTC